MKVFFILTGILVALSVAFVGCDLSPKKIVCDQFDLRTELKDGVLKFRIDTDLPDDTTVIVGVSRSYKEKGDSELYSVDYYSSKNSLLKFKNEQIVPLNNERWKRLLREKQVEMSRLGYGFDVASVSNKVELSAVVPIRQRNPGFGEDNVNLVGKAVTHRGFRTVNRKVMFKFPMKEPPVGRSPVPNLNPMDLDVGAVYTLSKKTPLMPHYNPGNPALAMRQVRYIQREGQIKILKKKNVNGTMWYRVSAKTNNGTRIGNGWINSIALLGQKLNGKYN